MALSGLANNLKRFWYEGKTVLWTWLLGAVIADCNGPFRLQVAFLISSLTIAILIFIMRTGTKRDGGLYEKRRVAFVMCCFLLINGFVTYRFLEHPSGQVLNDTGFWLANRVFYLFGLGFFIPPLLEPLLETDDDNEKRDGEMKELSIYVALVVIGILMLIVIFDRCCWTTA